MNRIYQGKVSKAELLDANFLSASNGERTKVRCRIHPPAGALASITPKEWDWESTLWDHHALFQDAVRI